MELYVLYPRSHTLGKTICYVMRTLKDGGGPCRRELSLLSKNQQGGEPPWGELLWPQLSFQMMAASVEMLTETPEENLRQNHS